MEILDYRFLGHQGALPLMTPGGLDPSDTITIVSTILKVLVSLNSIEEFVG